MKINTGCFSKTW